MADRPKLILDTGPLVALLAKRERHHQWAREALAVRADVISCEAVMSEAFFLIRVSRPATQSLLQLLDEGVITLGVAADYRTHVALMRKYASVPMSFADACLVMLSERFPNALVATLDSDFTIYRRRNRSVIPTLMP